MKRSPLLLFLILPECSMRHDGNIATFGQVLDGTGEQRLLIKFVESQVPVPGTGMAYDFHSLVWESKQGDEWSEKLTITRADFEKGADRRRWISDIHSLDST